MEDDFFLDLILGDGIADICSFAFKSVFIRDVRGDFGGIRVMGIFVRVCFRVYGFERSVVRVEDLIVV